MITNSQLHKLETTRVSENLLTECGLNSEYYIKPFLYIRNELHHILTCTGAEYKHAVEMARDEDLMPEDGGMDVIVDGILAMVYSTYLEAVGLDLITYFTYRFNPPSREFQMRLDRFEELVQSHKKGVI